MLMSQGKPAKLHYMANGFRVLVPGDHVVCARSGERIALEAQLRHAVQHQQLELYYQPQVDIRSGRIVGAEALLRWNDPQEGFISPARFIPVAESSGLIGPPRYCWRGTTERYQVPSVACTCT